MSESCPHTINKVVDSRPDASKQGWAAIRRRRECIECGARWTTIEIPMFEYQGQTFEEDTNEKQ